jgi:hypothetical protein
LWLLNVSKINQIYFILSKLLLFRQALHNCSNSNVKHRLDFGVFKEPSKVCTFEKNTVRTKLFFPDFRNQLGVAPSALTSRNSLIVVKRYKSVHKTCQKTNKFQFLCLPFKNELIGPQKHLNFFTWTPNADPISPSCSEMSILYA